jgi:2-haloacid dehalogenase
VKAFAVLVFDVFGTVVDWRGSVVREGRRLGREQGLRVDWPAFADAWRAGYRPAMDRVRRGELPWINIDGLHRLILDELIPRFGLDGLGEAERDHLNRVWHRLRPWPDAVAGLRRLKRHHVIATLSNGNVSPLCLCVSVVQAEPCNQSRGLRNTSYNRASGDPGSGCQS